MRREYNLIINQTNERKDSKERDRNISLPFGPVKSIWVQKCSSARALFGDTQTRQSTEKSAQSNVNAFTRSVHCSKP